MREEKKLMYAWAYNEKKEDYRSHLQKIENEINELEALPEEALAELAYKDYEAEKFKILGYMQIIKAAKPTPPSYQDLAHLSLNECEMRHRDTAPLNPKEWQEMRLNDLDQDFYEYARQYVDLFTTYKPAPPSVERTVASITWHPSYECKAH